MEDIETNVVMLDGIEYTEICRLDDNGNTYVFLSNINNPKQFCIKKLIKENDKELTLGIESDEEFNHLYELFMQKISKLN